MEDLLSIHMYHILDITVDNEVPNAYSPNVMEYKFGKSIHYQWLYLLYL